MAKVKRSLKVKFTDGTEKILELSKATALDMGPVPGMIHFDELLDKTWRLTYTSPVFEKTFKDN